MFAGQALQNRFPKAFFLLLLALLLVALPAFCQQDTITRFDAFAGLTYLNSPHISLAERGFHVQAGVRPKTWLSLGFDYSRATGDVTILPAMLLPTLQQTLGAQLGALMAAGKVPTTYQLTVPAHSVTHTFAVGPQFAYRHFKQFTLFVRPSAGAMRERATPHPGDLIAAGIVGQLAPAGSKLDWVKFYGFGGGIDLAPQSPVCFRVQFDLVRDHLFNDLLKDARNTVRVSIGPAFNFGRNIKD